MAALEEEWRDWASITEPLLLCVLSLFTTLADFFAFRAVCRSWRSIAVPNRQTMSSQSPIIIYPREVGLFGTFVQTLYDEAHRRNYRVVLPDGIIFGCSHGKLIVHQPRCKSFSFITLIDLFTGAKTFLPKRSCYTEKPYRFRLSTFPSSDEFVAVLQLKKHRALYCHHVGSPSWGSWRILCNEDTIEDILFFRNKLYVLTKSLQLGFFDGVYRHADLVLFDSVVVPSGVLHVSNDVYLAESGGELLMVCIKKVSGQEYCLLWRWNFECNGGWLHVSDLGERSLFFGDLGFVGSVSISKHSGFRRNCIYFVTDYDGLNAYSLRDEELLDQPGPYYNPSLQNGFPILILPNMF